jgi:hypothetical protein
VKKLIHKYLNSNFSIKDGSLIDNNSSYFKSTRLSQALTLIFGLTHKQLKWYIKSWVKKQDKSFDFNKWWSKKTFNYTWTHEMAQDISAYHGIDVQAEMEAVLAQQIALEIDTQILRDIVFAENNNTPSFSVRYVENEIFRLRN